MAGNQQIDPRVLNAAYRAIARARGQEYISVDPVDQGVPPSTSARLYKVSTTGKMSPVESPAVAVPASDAYDTAAHDPVHEDGGKKGPAHHGRGAFARRNEEEEANVVVPRGPAADSAPVTQASAGQETAAAPTAESQPAEGDGQAKAGAVSLNETAAAHGPRDAAPASQDSERETTSPIGDVVTTHKDNPAHRHSHIMASPADEGGAASVDVPDDELTRSLQPRRNFVADNQTGPLEPAVHAARPRRPHAPARPLTVPEQCGLFLDNFFAQLKRCGVKNVVVSPGSRSTPLAMKAYEHFGDVFVDVDERGAAFFALGLAKATGNVVALVCTSGTAVANWMPAVLEAEASRVPLLLLSADRPPRLQGVGAPQTCDQLHLFGTHVKMFTQMPLPTADVETLSYARQVALDACIAAHGALPNVASADAGPVHLNFPFEEPLKPAKCEGRIETDDLPASVVAGQGLMPSDAAGIFKLLAGKRVIALCGEGTCGSVADARSLLNFAHMRNVPLLADPLSGLRCYSDTMIIDHYDSVFGGARAPKADVVVRFGRWPVSKRACQAVRDMNALQIVVDMRSTRDFTSSTDLFVRCAPTVFAEAMANFASKQTADARTCRQWCNLNNEAAEVVRDVRLRRDNAELEGAYVYETVEAAPAGSLLFCANSMSIRALDTFYCKADKQLRVLCNRGLNGIDGTLSSAIGAAQVYDQTTVITGDLAFLHDINALALQNEMHVRRRSSRRSPSVIIVLLNNGGGGIFDMLPQKSDEAYFERLFLTPQSVDFKRVADGFGITFRTVSSVNSFRRTYSSLLGEPGISIIEVLVPLAGVEERYGRYWHI